MSSLEEGLRHFWLRDIHLVSGVTRQGLAKWLEDEKFVITLVKSQADFTIQTLDPLEAKRSLAHDSAKMACAAFETVLSINSIKNLPKSTAWIVIRAYYAAFYAAHSLLRMFGISCIHLADSQINALNHNAGALGIAHGFDKGYFIARYNTPINEIHFRSTKRGSHEILWDTFASQLRHISNHLLTISSGFNEVSFQLTEIEDILRSHGHPGGNWLSHIRNNANYRLDFGLWFPFSDSKASASELVKILQGWNKAPSNLSQIPRQNHILLHSYVCTLIVSICHAVVCDMAAHSKRKKSFHHYTSLALKSITN